MSKKNLINTYKTLKQNEAPDLWSRIEEGTDVVPHATAAANDAPADPKTKSILRANAGRLVFGFTAVALAIIIIIPVWRGSRISTNIKTDQTPAFTINKQDSATNHEEHLPVPTITMPPATTTTIAATEAITKGDLNMSFEFPMEDMFAAEAEAVMPSGSLRDYITTENFNTEEYNYIKENGFLSTLTNPLSTFSADVDTASYTNVRRMLNYGTKVDTAAIRLEEFLNYFSYDYNTPDGDAPFGVTTELADCPWNPDSKLLLIGLQAEEIDFENRPASNFVFLLDVSGSMNSPNKLPLMQKAFAMLAETLTENDRVSIVTYAGSDTVLLEGVAGNELLTITSAIESLEASGSTAGSAGINTAYRLAEKYFIPDGNNRVILATDGDLNVGVTSEAALTDLITKKRESGIYLSVLGFGTGNIKDNKMEALADNGNGNYSYIDSIFEAKKVLVNEMGGTLYTVAKDVKLQVEFNPAKVSKYRLIGYENRQLKDYEFNDDTVDAGEIGAGHSVTAVYELILTDSDKALSASEYALKYQTATLTDSDDLFTLSIRYKKPDSDVSTLLEYPVLPTIYSEAMPDNLKFAACVLEFGMLLRESEYKGTSSYDNVLIMLSELGNYVTKDAYKEELRELVKMAQNMPQ